MTAPACPACGSERVSRAYRDPALSFQRCRACLSVFDAAPPSKDDVMAIYEGKGYYVRDDRGADAIFGYADDYLADREFIEEKFDRVLAHLERYAPPGRLLDVGAGPGFMVATARRRGWDAVGIDVNEWAASYARSELGLDVRVGELDENSFKGEQFDAVTMMDLVEHVPDPDQLLAQARRLVRPGGALALLTPDAGSPVSRLLGSRWPEVSKPGEHMVLFSTKGLSHALTRHGFVATGWHSIGKTAPLSTLAADVAPAAPGLAGRARDLLETRSLGRRVVDFDPRTKFCLYARRLPDGVRVPSHEPAKLPRHAEVLEPPDVAINEELEAIAGARRRVRWLYDTFAAHVPGARVLEIGAGIGTFTELMLTDGARSILAVEPEVVSASTLAHRFRDDERVRVARDELPDAPSVDDEAGTFDLVVCHNVLEHIADDAAAMAVMAKALRPDGRLALLVPAGPQRFGALDDAYGHWRRYTEHDVRTLVSEAGLEIDSLHPIDALGVPAWWFKNRRPGARIGTTSVRAYELLVAAWKPIESRLRPATGLGYVCVAHKVG
jgi:2-polyprenyl-3-methyl-5-hydroxy-6-metoxy-1,4-benzoquinol methylase